MRNQTLRACCVIVLPAIALTAIFGCGAGTKSLPETVTVQLPDGTETQTTLGAGVITLADSTWEFFATSGTAQGLPFVTITFGPEGNLESFEDSTIIPPEIFGSSILFDEQRHATAQQALTYEAGVAGSETSDGSGFAFVGLLNAFAPVIGKVAAATATASGTFDPDDPDTMLGTFSFAFEVLIDISSIPGIPTEPQEDEFAFIAHRILGE